MPINFGLNHLIIIPTIFGLKSPIFSLSTCTQTGGEKNHHRRIG